MNLGKGYTGVHCMNLNPVNSSVSLTFFRKKENNKTPFLLPQIWYPCYGITCSVPLALLDQSSSRDSKGKERCNGLGHSWKMNGRKKRRNL